MHSNKYIFIYASILVVVVALLLSVVSTVLKPVQDNNVNAEKMQNILASVNIESSRNDALVNYKKYIREAKIVNSLGEDLSGDAFAVDLNVELRKDIKDRLLPVYIAEIESQKYYIIPVRGKGLWGPIWGYISLMSDMETVYGANFDHKSETPGLGAEINTPAFKNQFKGKKIFDDKGAFISVTVVKGGAPDDDPYGVDAISGGTITSNGVSKMLFEGLKSYESYFKKIKQS